MAYVVLARKYRPRSFEQMVGQEHVVRALSNALQQHRLHHAYLFTGTRGIGKTTVSRILAKSLNCTGSDGLGGITATPCGVCPACVEIDEDRYMDYIELDAASNRGIDEARDLLERAAYKPSIGRFKVFMIDEAHQLTKDAFSALLKTLEEPPEYLKFVLATTDPEKMLPTVLSRCLQFNLRPMAPEVVLDHLQQVLQAEGVPSDAASLRLLSRAARGSMRDALSLTDQAIAYGGGQLDEAGVRAMLGAVDRGHAAALVQALAQRDGRALLARLDGLRALGLSADGTLESMAVLLQQMALEQAVPGVLDAGEPEHADARRLAGAMPADETQLLYSIVLQGRGELQLMSDEYSALTMVLLRMLAFAPPSQARAAAEGAGAAARNQAATSAQADGLVKAPPSKAGAPPMVRPEVRPEVRAVAQTRVPPVLAQSPEPPPWVDLPPPEEDTGPQPGSAALRASAPPAMAVATCAPPAPEAFVPTPLGERWADLVGRLVQRGAVTALARELAWQAGLASIDAQAQPPIWHLEVERDSLRTDALRDKLCLALMAELGQPVQLLLDNCVPADSPARRDAAERERRQRQAESAIRSDPLVLDLMSQFKGARIVPGSIKPI
ncbi:MAG: DNA polymerase III subunit gamma/tau [Rubrivivax sp.]